MFKEVIFGTIGGLGIFLYGMKLMSDGLKRISGEKLKRVLSVLTRNRVMAVLVGAGFTALIQSSSAMTVMAVGLVNSGFMSLTQAIGVVIGANIGTTITAWLVSALAVFKISQYAYPAIGVGFLMTFIGKRRSVKNWGTALLGFGLIFLGLAVLKESFGPLKESVFIKDMFVNFGRNPILGIFVGAAATMILQSSSVTVAVIQVMAFQGLLDFQSAIPLILGDNIGTTLTAQLASLKTSPNARRTANAHTGFNIFGVIYILPFVWLGHYPRLIEWIVPGQITPTTIMVHIAVAHTVFNVVNTLIFLPFTGYLEKFVVKITPAKKGMVIEGRLKYLDRKQLTSQHFAPHFALTQAQKEVVRMAEMADKAVKIAMEGLFERNNKQLELVPEMEDAIDDLQREITRYMVDLSRRHLPREIADEIPVWLHSINDIEKIGDHAENLGELTERVLDEKLQFSAEGKSQLKEMYEYISEMLTFTNNALLNIDRESATAVLVMEQKVNDLHIAARQDNLDRMNSGITRPTMGILFLDYIQNLEKIGDHLSNIAIAVKRDFRYGAITDV
ncbi:MAG: Na/Pi cotransporter family protein [Candidatus Zixiibacteriota bacterium]|nr:MAG: Na/Pi cotransporter family protein [candidate division Zixibacteria bacterium]